MLGAEGVGRAIAGQPWHTMPAGPSLVHVPGSRHHVTAFLVRPFFVRCAEPKPIFVVVCVSESQSSSSSLSSGAASGWHPPLRLILYFFLRCRPAKHAFCGGDLPRGRGGVPHAAHRFPRMATSCPMRFLPAAFRTQSHDPRGLEATRNLMIRQARLASGRATLEDARRKCLQ